MRVEAFARAVLLEERDRHCHPKETIKRVSKQCGFSSDAVDKEVAREEMKRTLATLPLSWKLDDVVRAAEGVIFGLAIKKLTSLPTESSQKGYADVMRALFTPDGDHNDVAIGSAYDAVMWLTLKEPQQELSAERFTQAVWISQACENVAPGSLVSRRPRSARKSSRRSINCHDAQVPMRGSAPPRSDLPSDV